MNQKRELVPKLLTGLVAACFLLGAETLIRKELSNDGSHGRRPGSEAVKEGQHYQEINKGETVNGWELVYRVKREVSNNPDLGVMSTKFKGFAALTGTITMNRENKILFFPDEDSIKKLPLESFPAKLALSFSNKGDVTNAIMLEPGGQIEGVTFEIDS